MSMSIAENVAAVRARIDAAAQGRRVLLVAASKMNDAERVREAVAAGVDACGENRVQELVEKNAQGAYEGAPLHFIGHLQKNKIKYLVGVADLIESVDSEELLTLIDRRAEKLDVVQDVLLEVNIGREAAKSGLAPEDVAKTVEFASPLEHVRVRGLMAIPPVPMTCAWRTICAASSLWARPAPENMGSFCPRISEHVASMELMPVRMQLCGYSRLTGLMAGPLMSRRSAA